MSRLRHKIRALRVPIRDFKIGIRNLIRWFPTIWGDRNWDYWYLERMLLKKLTFMRDRQQEIQFFEGWENEVKWMNICIYLLTELVKDEIYDWKKEKKMRNLLWKVFSWRYTFWWD